jgi:hypothetical protein
MGYFKGMRNEGLSPALIATEGRPGGEARAALGRVKLEQIGDRYALFREEDWQRMAGRYGSRQHWKNATAVRPDYIADYD